MPRARAVVASMPLPIHGGWRAVSPDSAGVVDFSVCLNAHGPSGDVIAAIAACEVAEYPDPASLAVRTRAAAYYGRPVNEIVLGAGSAELIHAVCQAYLEPGRRALLLRPCFGEYERAARLTGATVSAEWSTEALIPAIQPDVALVFVASPTSPQGRQLPLATLETLAAACRTVDALLVLDQAYDAFATAPHGTPALPGHSHVMHLRSLTKDHALAGARVAFAVCPPDVAEAVERVRVPWAASAPTQAAATALLMPAAREHAMRSVALLRAEVARMSAVLQSMDIPMEQSDTHYRLVRCHNASVVRDALLTRHAILVRDATSFGLPTHVRIAARTPADNDRLLHAVRSNRSLFSTCDD